MIRYESIKVKSLSQIVNLSDGCWSGEPIEWSESE